MEIARNVARHKLRSFLTISGITIGVLALTTMGALAENFNALIDGGVAYFGSSVQVGPPDGQSTPILPISKVDEIKKIQGVAAAFPGYTFNAKPGQLNFSFGVADQIVASDPAEAAWGAIRLTYAQGHAIEADSQDQVVLGTTIAKEFSKKVGDTIELPVRPPDAKPDFVSHSFKVVGILNTTRTAPDNFAYINITDGQMLLKDSLPDPIRTSFDVTQVTQAIAVYAKAGTSLDELDRIASRINQQVEGVKALKPSDIVNGFKQGSVVFTGITTAAALLALIIGGLSVVNTMFMAVAERVREIGLKKAVGATTFNVMGEFLLEATFIGLVGGLLGYGLGVAIVVIRNTFFEPADGSTLFLITPTLTIFAIGFATVLGAVAGVLPAWRAARLDPVIALRNE
ncbi:MAG: ABC transporter permease [Chloroflexi bacterium]|nr:MAG: ABC transporter permease [Chloroflexota bacterium]TMG46968.1 MAG: ABC transporter permease [Chloroflexota bacterium]